jgi:hypothetical protein
MNKNAIAPMNPIVPFNLDMGPYEAMLEAVREMNREYGIRRLLVTGPNLGVRFDGFPEIEVYRKIGEGIRRLQGDVADLGVEIGWWCAPSIRCGLGAPFQHIVGGGGSVSPHGLCPLDDAMAADLAAKVALVAAIARPFMIQFEDDFEVSNHPVTKGFGCLCPLHLAEVKRRAGRSVRAEDVEAIFQEPNAGNRALRQTFADVCRDSLVGLAARIRAAVDAVSPETRLCQCEPGCTEKDGWLSEAVCRAFAGKGTRPAIRLYGSQYYSQNSPATPPATLSHVFYSAEHLPEDFELFHESDTYPHTRFYMSAAYLETLLHGAFAAGVDDSLLYATQYLDDPCEERGYFEMLRRNRPRFDAFRAEVARCRLCGCGIVHSPAVQYLLRGNPGKGLHSACQWLGRYGIPYTTRPSSVRVVASGQEAAVIADDDVRRMLESGGTLLDAEAALDFASRGFAPLLGVEVEPLERLDAMTERILPAADAPRLRGKLLYNLASLLPASSNEKFVKLQPMAGAETLVEYCGRDGRSISPALTRFVNRTGGRVAILAGTITESASFYCHRKREVVRRLMEFLDGADAIPAMALDAPNLWLLCNQALDGSFLLLSVNNLSPDALDGLSLRLSPAWRNCTVQELDPRGRWVDALTQTEGEILRLPGEFRCLATRLFKVNHDVIAASPR